MTFPTVNPADAALLALMGQAEEKTATGSKLVTLKPGVHRIRILPNKDTTSPAWWRTFGTHFIPTVNPAPGTPKGKMFLCDAHSYDKPCSLCDAVAKGKKSDNPMIKELAGQAYSSPRHICNFVNLNENPNKVQVLKMNTTLRNVLFQAARLINLRFFDLDANYVLHLEVKAVPNSFKQEYRIMQAEQPTASGFTVDKLFDLEAIVQEEVGNLKTPADFTGDFTAPALAAPAGAPGGALGFGGSPAGALPLAAPAAPVEVPVAPPEAAPMPVAAPVEQPAVVMPQMGAPITPAMAMTPTPAPAAPVEVPVEVPVAAPVMVEQPVAAPVAAPVVTAPVEAPVAAQAQAPAVAPTAAAPAGTPEAMSAADEEALKAKLMAMLGGTAA